jgi:hypothetical protein
MFAYVNALIELQNNHLTRPCFASDPKDDLVTVMFFGQALDGEQDNVFLGHIAVPAARVAEGGLSQLISDGVAKEAKE